MKKVINLTEEQKSKIPDYIKKWTDIGLSTDPANRIEAEKYINLAYSNVRANPPEEIVWCGSPFSQALTIAIILDNKIGASVLASLRDSVWDSVQASVLDSVVDSMRDSVLASELAYVRAYVMDSVRDSVEDSVRYLLLASVWDSVWDSVRVSVWDSVWDSVWASVRAPLWASAYGQHDAHWLGFYDFFRNECGLIDETEKIKGLIGIAKNAGWFSPHEKICFVSERPNVLNLNENGKLHCLDGPALSYPDGWCIYAKNGILVQECEITNKRN